MKPKVNDVSTRSPLSTAYKIYKECCERSHIMELLGQNQKW